MLSTTDHPLPISPALRARLAQVRHVALDMDGTIYSGNTVFAATRPFLDTLSRLGIGCTFLTNNSSKSVKEYLAHLDELGISAGEARVQTSAQATIEHLRRHFPAVCRLFVLGTTGLRAEFVSAGFTLSEDHPEDVPDAVVVGFDTGLTYARLCRAAYWIKQGKPFIATHPDRVCPTDSPTVLIDCGSICAALEKAVGRGPGVVLGKPHASMLEGLLAKHQLRAADLAMVGDRLYTDMAMAHAVGAFGVLVLTGETTAEEAARHSPKPDLVVQTLRELGEFLVDARNGGAGV